MEQVRGVRRSVILALLVALLAVGGVAATPSAHAVDRWAPAASAPVHPGVQLYTPIGQCTSNFVFVQGDEVYLGMAAHCVGQGVPTNLDGCRVPSLPVGTPVRIVGATRPGTLAYSSWLAMQAAEEDDLLTCLGNDFALVRVDPADRDLVNPSVPHWGGPTGIRQLPQRALSSLYSIGNSSLRSGSELLQPKLGVSLGSSLGGWRHTAYQVLPGLPGDSGGPTLDGAGRAAGVLSALGIAPRPLSNQLTDMWQAVHYARAHGMPELLLALGTEPFRPHQLPLG